MRMTGASGLCASIVGPGIVWVSAPVADFLEAAAVNDEIVLEDQGIICDGIGAFGVIDIHTAVGLAGSKE